MRIHRRIIPILTLFILFSVPVFMGGNAQAETGKWEIFELTLTTTNSYSNEYTDATLTATFTAPSNNTIVMPGFWDGSDTWKVRMAPNEIGTWTYVTTSNDGQLDNQSGQFECIGSSRKGFIKLDTSDPYKFQYADGSPFFWMGDTCWHLFNNNIVYDGVFKDYIDRRASQHFTNIHAGLYCGNVYENEGGKPFPAAPGDMDNLNPDYFRYVDRKVDYITSKGMVMGFFLTWAQQFVAFSRAQFERYETYVIARYAAYAKIVVTTCCCLGSSCRLILTARHCCVLHISTVVAFRAPWLPSAWRELAILWSDASAGSWTNVSFLPIGCRVSLRSCLQRLPSSCCPA